MENIEESYDALAAKWAEAFAREHDHKPMDQELLQTFALRVGEREPVLDLGCASGNTSRFLKDLGLSVSGLDVSEAMLQQARSRHPDISFRKADMLDLPFDDASIAAVVSFYAIIHFSPEQVDRAFAEVFRVLRPGGIFFFTFHAGDAIIRLKTFLDVKIDLDFRLFSPETVSRSLAAHGFEQIELIEREPYPGVEYPSQRAYVFCGKPAASR